MILFAAEVLAQEIPADPSQALPIAAEPGAQADQQTTTLPAPQATIVRPEGRVIVPASSVARPEDAGIRAHTNHLIFVPKVMPVPGASAIGETPASMGCVYNVSTHYTGCNPANGGGNHPTGGWGAIALVDAFDNPNIASDLAYFSSYFGLPTAQFFKVYANTSWGTLNGLTASCSGTPPGNTGWGMEESLDVQWAHAMAPNSKIILVEACSNSFNDLYFAEQVAGRQVNHYGGGDISNSWGGGEYANEVNADNFFYRYWWNKIVYFASAGDSGWGAQYPSSSPWVVSAGGTTINRDGNGNFVSESCWSGSGGGVSTYEVWQNPPNISNGMGPWTDYQYPMFGAAPYESAPRQTPDIAFDADPASGAWVYDTYGYSGWNIIGGTSLSSPALAGLINTAKQQFGQAPLGGGHYTNEENNMIYGALFSHIGYQYYYDVTTGSNGANATAGYDQCTGVGTPRGKAYK